MRTRAEVLGIRCEGRDGAGADRVGPSLLVGLLAGLLGNALARLRHARAAAEILDIRHVCRGSSGLLGIGPGLLVPVLARLIVGTDYPLGCLRDVPARTA